jgi:hypothetical protein
MTHDLCMTLSRLSVLMTSGIGHRLSSTFIYDLVGIGHVQMYLCNIDAITDLKVPLEQESSTLSVSPCHTGSYKCTIWMQSPCAKETRRSHEMWCGIIN